MSKKSKAKKLDADLDVELDEYEPSDSEDDYSEEEKLLLENVRKRRRDFDDESEEEVLGIASEDDEDEEGNDDDETGDDMVSDLDGAGEDDELPDVKAWGRKKKNFYNTDYVDNDYGGFQKEEEEEAARLEEEEARQIQKRLASHMRDEDFGLSSFISQDKKSEEKTEEVIATDLTKLSKRQKLSLMQKESPEFFSLTKDFSEKMTVLKDELEPVMVLIRAQKIPDCPAAKFVTTLHHLILNYCSNVSFYLLLKALRTPITSHPVVGRLAKYRKLLVQAENVYNDVVQPQLADILTTDWDSITATTRLPEKQEKKKKPLRLLSAPVAENIVSDELEAKEERSLTPEKKRKQEPSEKMQNGVEEAGSTRDPTGVRPLAYTLPSGSEGEESAAEGIDVGERVKQGDRRAITYEMAKNKGLTPYRKKELRNPRVRHRRKYEKARVRRKGQVREPRSEVKKYGGEISGIKIGVTKSIKLKV